jgi:hypothetical protein
MSAIVSRPSRMLMCALAAAALVGCGDAATGGGKSPDDGVSLTDRGEGGRTTDALAADALPFVDVRVTPEAGARDGGAGGGGGGGGASGGGPSGGGGGANAGDALPPPGDECTVDADCDDGLFCSGVERCLRGVCFADPRPPCADDLPCTSNLCDEDANACTVLPDDAQCAAGEICDVKVGCFLPIGCTEDAECDDGLPCNGTEACVQRMCRPGTPVACDDAVSCTIDTCNDDTGACGSVPDHGACLPGELCSLIEGCAPRPPCVRDDECDDGIYCNGQETCDVDSGLCRGGAAPVVDDGVACTQDVCSEAGGSVTHTPRNNRCQDGVFCNGAEVCHPQMGCQPGVAPNVNDGVACTLDACDEDADFISHTPRDGVCDDGLFCNGTETCDPLADCRPGEPPVVNDGVGCTQDTCSEVEQRVVHRTDDARCDDGVFCNGPEVCDAEQGCLAGAGLPLDDGLPCTDDECVEGRREVLHTPVHARCEDALFCNGEELCVPDVGCIEGTPPDVNDGVPCTMDTCDEARRRAAHTPDDAVCDNGVACDGPEICNADQGCLPGVNPALDDRIDCTDDVCDPRTGAVSHVPNDGRCDDALFCNGTETCDAQRGCVNGRAPIADDGINCTSDVCDEAADRIRHDPVNARCDDALFCNGAEICDAARGCQAGTAPDLADAVGCTVDACDEANDRVIHTPDNARCSDNLVCNGAELCDAVRGCGPGAPAAAGTVCGAPRNICLNGACGASRCGDGYTDAGAAPPEACDGGANCNNMCQLNGGGAFPTGNFAANPRLVYACQDAFFGADVVNIDTAVFTFSVAGAQLSVSGLEPGVMTQSPVPAGMDFAVRLVLAGGCQETYALSGTFTDANHWCGTFTATYSGAQCGLTNCSNQRIAVCGTRQ